MLSSENFYSICDRLATTDEELKFVLDKHGYPPMWTRANTFETLVHLILEQQVSLASALAALNKLREKTGSVTPEIILSMPDAELRECFFSRQKSAYVKGLAAAILNKEIDLGAFESLPDDEVRKGLGKLKGIGNWTIDVYLIFVLKRMDVFPVGDLAAVNALKRLKKTPPEATRDELLAIAEKWRPYRTVATMILWHYYLSSPVKRKKIVI